MGVGGPGSDGSQNEFQTRRCVFDGFWTWWGCGGQPHQIQPFWGFSVCGSDGGAQSVRLGDVDPFSIPWAREPSRVVFFTPPAESNPEIGQRQDEMPANFLKSQARQYPVWLQGISPRASLIHTFLGDFWDRLAPM